MHGTIGRPLDDMLDARTAERLSTRLRLARQMRGMTLKALADMAGCSESLLSKIENGKAYPSLPMLSRLVQALDIGMGWMFEDRDGRAPVIARSGQRSATAVPVDGGRVITVEKVIPETGQHNLQCSIFHLEAGVSSPGEQRHAGEETGYLLDGHVELLIDGRPHRLSPGDAFAFHSDQPHSFRNVGQTRASIFWVNTPPML